MSIPANTDVVIVGASWAGIWMLHQMRLLGLRAYLIEARAGVGGVWFYTHYPGCRVDTEVPFYEFAAPELWRHWNWKERFAKREDIQKYLEAVCDRLDLWPHITLGTLITGASWDDDEKRWHVSTSDGTIIKSQFFVPCTGYSTVPVYPTYDGIGRFKNGFHTSRWPENLDVARKRVGIIGTGASGTQVIEAIAPKVAHLTVFQRTPNLATPRSQVQYSTQEFKRVKEHYPYLFEQRLSTFGVDCPNRRPRTFDDDPETRHALYDGLYRTGGLSFWFRNYADMTTDSRANQEAYNFWRSRTLPRIRDPDVASKLAPAVPPHAFGIKRPSLETEYFEVFNQSNVSLIDLGDDPLVRETAHSVVCQDSGSHEFDILIYATGFDFVTASVLQMDIRGRNGLILSEKWNTDVDSSGIWTYLGIMSAGFPNMFFPVGPQAPTALGITPFMAELQGRWISDIVRHLRTEGKTTVEPTSDSEVWWKNELISSAYETLFPQTNSWYMGVNVPRRKKEPRCYLGGVDRYAKFLDESAVDGYQDCSFE
ncbi:cyclohexanone monooxygenase [Dactylonectria estremocensis]|uniref:Cyclohexanone monooxygenase n=1 Tax=Dactylonectria estremocensis TaxID=1079267 RepID=A0A9P9EH68_9HYPO|nr:cyclohexanone monooxygenase [Dactylonectria estremocensis]